MVVDDKNNQQCAGAQLAGVVFNHLYTNHDEPVVIRQVALARVTPDILGKQACFLEEYRLVYLIASVHRPDDSVCTHELNNGRVRRAWRTLFGFGLPDLPAPEISSKMSELPLILPAQLANYAVVMPDADYDSDGTPQTSDSTGLSKVPYPDLEWYELACGGGALAHTDLNGLVEVGEQKAVRTAALRMLRANYRGNRTETLEGVPISFQRDKPHTPQYNALCEKSRSPTPEVSSAGDRSETIDDKDVEARWTATGAVCVSRSRLWMKDGVVTAAQRYPGMTLKASEQAFLGEIRRLPPLKDVEGVPVIKDLQVPCDSSFKDPSFVWFTSGVLHHIEGRR